MASHVRKPGREADEVDVVLGARVEVDDLGGRQVEPAGDFLEIGTVDSAVGARELHPTARRGRGIRQSVRQLEKPRPERRPRQDARIVLDQKRSERGHRVDEPRHPRVEQQALQGQRARVRLAGDLVAEFDRDGAVPGGKQARRRIEPHSTEEELGSARG